jgi:hypothetical protein
MARRRTIRKPIAEIHTAPVCGRLPLEQNVNINFWPGLTPAMGGMPI